MMLPSPAELYRTAIEGGKIKEDPAQGPIVAALNQLAEKLSSKKKGTLPFLKPTDPHGLYIYGTVGRGKTMLMDMFFASLTNIPKRRVHFHAFMMEAHERLHELRRTYMQEGKSDQSIPLLAKEIAREAQLLCFDEFQVYNIADAMILGRLFQFLFREGVTIVATSNSSPENLYKDGLQRALFLPFIDLIKKRLKVMEIGTGNDYRLSRLKGLPVYLMPHDNQSYTALQKIFDRLTDNAKPQPEEIALQGRKLTIPKAAKHVAWFTFEELCQMPLAASDYLALAKNFHTVILENVPRFNDEKRDEVLRFIYLIDVLYEKHARVVISAAAQPDALLPENSTLWQQYGRTASRLAEMQSAHYLQGARIA